MIVACGRVRSTVFRCGQLVTARYPSGQVTIDRIESTMGDSMRTAALLNWDCSDSVIRIVPAS